MNFFLKKLRIFGLTNNFFDPICSLNKKAKPAARRGWEGTGLKDEASLPGKGIWRFLFIRCFRRDPREGGKNDQG